MYLDRNIGTQRYTYVCICVYRYIYTCIITYSMYIEVFLSHYPVLRESFSFVWSTNSAQTCLPYILKSVPSSKLFTKELY